MARRKHHSLPMAEDSDYGEGSDEYEAVSVPQTEKIKRVRVSEEKNGWIKSIELTDFMCHRHLLVKLGSAINFITGNNGSGKSAILTALTICLGGRASTTQRASTLSSLIREGAENASVKVTLYNGAEFNAFRPDKYGDAIVIERRFGRAPGSANRYIVYGANGRIVSEKKEEINQICDHFAIQVDNPLAVLTQETAKRFLSSAKPKELYEFFMKATQLEQLAYDYMFSLDRINTATSRIDAIKSTWAGKEAQVKKLETLYQEVSRQKEIRQKIKNVKSQIAWSVVETKEKEAKKVEVEMGKRGGKLERLEQERLEIIKRSESIQDEIAGLQKEANEFSVQLQPVQQAYTKLETDLRGKHGELSRVKANYTEANGNFKLEKLNFDRLTGQIEDERKKNQNNHQTALIERVNELTAEIQALNQELAGLRQREEQLKESRKDLNQRHQKAKGMLEATQTRYNAKRQQLDQLRRSKGNRLQMYGDRMSAFMAELTKAAPQFHRKPVGPVGMFVELLDPKWALPVEVILGKELESFIVKDQHDHDLLRKVMGNFKLHFPICIVRDDTPLDFSSGEPDQRFVTALRTISVSHPLVLKALVIQTGIERAVFMPDRQSAKDVLRHRTTNVDSAYTPTDRVFVNGTSHSSNALYPGNKIHYIQSDNQSRIEELERETKQIQAEVELVTRDLAGLGEQMSRLATELTEIDSAATKAESRLRQCRFQLQKTEGELNGIASFDVAAVEDDRRKVEEAMDLIKGQFVSLSAQQEAIKAEIGELEGQMEENAAQQQALKDEAEEVLDRLQKASTFRRNADKELGVIDQNKAYCNSEIDVSRAQLERLKTELTSLIADVQKYSERVPVTMEMPALEKELARLNTVLAELTRDQPDPEKLLEEITTLKDSIARSKRMIEGEDALLQKMKQSIRRREKIWVDWRQQIANLSNMEFILMLQARGHEGKLEYDTEAQQLNIRVKPQAQVAADMIVKGRSASPATDTEERDIRQLSGGEKSYSTACFLFSLWTAMASPLRALDEFDVFMDQVNRDFVIDQLLKNARSSKVQFILITPNSIWNSVKYDHDVRVIALPDPDRRQRTIV